VGVGGRKEAYLSRVPTDKGGLMVFGVWGKVSFPKVSGDDSGIIF
jgi:hypothetical protein